ncbi:phosphoenolpyruvate hydrolase family protein [Aquisalimonas lutea]|uniref:phosphoenolpyruvate hydrolase family protein n=1 Tax=Aquisalimonas lutea TaxID=1327750 RepID=UPI0025B4B0F3|nr:phosphoenolpyruvate hydrolase family protein [Aquisalimonas lutea]MDN3516966.1 phosphoenolpyruvate hydrolase family protein [Aquisalimonas lutea]
MVSPGAHDGWLVGSSADAVAHSPAPCLLSPLTAGLDPHLATMACVLPVGDVNGSLRDAAAAQPPPDGTLAGVLAHDPFRRTGDLLAELGARGVHSIVNWPSVAPLSGELAAALEHSGFTYQREIDLLREARAGGFRVAAVVHTRDQLQVALELGPDRIVVTPGLTTADARERRRQGEATTALARSAQQRSGNPVWLHLHPGFAEWLEGSVPAGVVVLRHAAGSSGA